MVTAEVMEAKSLTDQRSRWETRGPGDTDNAMRRVSQRHGLDYGALWSLRYRPPKRVWADILSAIKAAHASEKQRQIRMLAHDIAVTEATAGHSVDRLAEARAVLRSAAGASSLVVDEERE